jgi:hypothetical protein
MCSNLGPTSARRQGQFGTNYVLWKQVRADRELAELLLVAGFSGNSQLALAPSPDRFTMKHELRR